MIILGEKVGMSQVFTDNGLVVPVTVIQAGPCFVMQVKTVARDGYSALQIGFGDMRKNKVTKPEAGHAAKAGVPAKRHLKEVRIDEGHGYKVGDEIKADIFNVGDFVDVSAKTKGRGFTGAVKRWNISIQKMSHGGGPVHRHVGSMGANSDPSRVFKNKKMAGQYGNENVTIQNLEVVKIDLDKNCILIKGGIPGADGGLVSIKPSVKKGKKEASA